jgi:DNA-binding beta-propeller fold protein YncE
MRRCVLLLRIASISVAIGMMATPAFPTGADSQELRQARGSSTLFGMAQRGTVLLVLDVNSGTSTVIGNTGFPPQSLALAITPDGATAYTIANTQDSTEAHLAKLDLATGAETLVGSHPLGQDLYIMGMTFSPDGTLYGAGDFDPTSPAFNSLYTIDVSTGLATRVGPFGGDPTKSAFIMSFSFDPGGTLYGASMMSLYTIDRTTGAAAKMTDFVGAVTDPPKIMGIAFDENGKLYAADYLDLPDGGSNIYLVDLETGLLTPAFKPGIAFVHNIAFGPDAKPQE